jgi:hypothetical protein
VAAACGAKCGAPRACAQMQAVLGGVGMEERIAAATEAQVTAA